MLGVPVLAGAAAYAIAEASAWRGTLEDRPRLAKKFYGVVGAAMIIGLILNYAGFNAVKMLFWAAVLNGILAPPLIVLVVLLTSNKKIMGQRANPPLLKWLGWATAVIMAVAAIALFATM
jgi:Mn2+/Fe2+ NRAMP family transporter